MIHTPITSNKNHQPINIRNFFKNGLPENLFEKELTFKTPSGCFNSIYENVPKIKVKNSEITNISICNNLPPFRFLIVYYLEGISINIS